MAGQIPLPPSAALRGATVGQELKFEVNYPEDFGEKRLAGKNVSYDVAVKGIERRVQPELNDDFAKELGDYSSYEDFTTKFRENLQSEKDPPDHRPTLGDRLLTALSERFQFPVPESMIQTADRRPAGPRASLSRGAGHALKKI